MYRCRSLPCPAGEAGSGDPQVPARRGGSRRLERFEAAPSAPTSIRQGRFEGAFTPQVAPSLWLEELAGETGHARGKRRLGRKSTAVYSRAKKNAG